MEHLIVLAIAISVFVLLIGLIAWNHSKTGRKTGRGSLPAQGKHILHSSYNSHDGAIRSTQTHIPKDPQDFAKAMMPKSKGNAK
ncbi:hypothetical protein [Ruegeria sp. R8_2]|uniref:hypothetical protein n=1 Tax=Ruegeria sp. R8_2 TaxID=2821110 RepID=UPI001ADBF5A5|nr:hypothetical protein [Ruegeria sp. R8_2]MBO9413269.1 hypothetical protein [Ruegeria sp. R8_1]